MDKHLVQKFGRVRREAMERAALFLMERADELIEAYKYDDEYDQMRSVDIASELRNAAAQVRRLAEAP